MVGLDLLRQHSDVAVFDAELIVAGAVLGVVRPHLLVAERFKLLESFIERHGRHSTRVSSLWECGVPRPPALGPPAAAVELTQHRPQGLVACAVLTNYFLRSVDMTACRSTI